MDLDPQGNLAEDLGDTDDDRDDTGRALAQALMFGGGAAPIREVRPNLNAFAGGPALDQATAGLAAKANKDLDGAKLAVAHLLEPIACASNAPFSEWGHTFTDPRLAPAIVDRLTFRGHIIYTGTASYRLKTTQKQPRSR